MEKKEEYETLIESGDLKEKIAILNWQNNIYDFIYSCDFYISTSTNEGLGNAYLASHLLESQTYALIFQPLLSLILYSVKEHHLI